ncbi:MAG: YtxH domain-containing protein [Thermomicrobiales bacterium]|nr:YtxH domain-containing protein [Thermomicrobiales bacterium]
MSFLGKVISFAVGAAAGAAGGVAAARLLAPQSGEETQRKVDEFRHEVEDAGLAARAETEAIMVKRYRDTLERVQA